jgi:glycosyltransferase involved in cell wall biosynthesis
LNKIALVHQNQPSGWTSCRSITRGLIAAYRDAQPDADLRSFSLNLDLATYGVLRLAERILEFNPDAISFVDHAPHPAALIRALAEVHAFAKRPLPKLILHVFGDFPLKPGEWLAIETILKESDVRFVCASEKQRALLESFIHADAGAIEWIPFPVYETGESFDQDLRNQARKDLGLAPEEQVFLYAGRMSLQKNVLLLVKAFFSYSAQFDPSAKLLLAGPIDDIGVPYLGKLPPPGLFSFDLRQLLDAGSRSASPQAVRYLGDLSAKDLRAVYHASDLYVSLSTHNDEDFGMSPAEAAVSGAPLVLTDWGGFSSFRTLLGDDTVLTVPVKIHDKSVSPSAEDCVRALLSASRSSTDAEARSMRARRACGHLSVAGVASRIRKLTQSEKCSGFVSFTPLFGQVARAFRLNPEAPFSSGLVYSSLYREVYGATYVG